MSNMIPFGKHKGKPVEALLDDREYLDWLLSQGWFQQRYDNLYQIVINNGVEPSETPEHNAMQIRFLEEEYCLRFAYTVKGLSLFALCNAIETWKQIAEIEARLTIWQSIQWYGAHTGSNMAPARFRDYRQRDQEKLAQTAMNLTQTAKLIAISSPRFETSRGIDVCFDIRTGIQWCASESVNDRAWPTTSKEFIFPVEIKPTIGDDYPAILRQVKRSGADCLLVRSYTGIGATKEQFVRLFDSQGIKVIFESDVDQVELPPFDRELSIDLNESKGN